MSNCMHVSCIKYSVVSKKLSDPSTWTCDQCTSNTESVWICLQCAHTGCGRTCKQKHAQKHYSLSHHPVVLHINQKMLFCYKCDDYILNDTQFGEIALLREQLSCLQNQRFESSTTRQGSVIRGPLKQFKFVDQREDKIQNDMRPGFSGEFTAKRFYALNLMKKCVNAWKIYKFEGEVKTSDTAPPSPNPHDGGVARRFKGRTGLRNIGNTCYQNATLMCLSSIAAVRELFLSLPDPAGHDEGDQSRKRTKLDRRSSEDLYRETHSRRISSSGPETTPTMMTQLHKLLRVLWSGKWAGISPAFFVKSFMMAVPSFQGYIQHDAHEFLTALLEQLQNDKAHDSNVRTIISNVFTCTQISETLCHECQNKSVYTFPGATCITLDLSATVVRLQEQAQSNSDARYPRRRASVYTAQAVACSLLDCLSTLVAPVELSDCSQYRCVSAKCNGRLVNATKREAFSKLSRCVIFHINRTKWDSKGKRKVTQMVKFPLRDLDLSIIASKNEDALGKSRYSLKGVILHHGPDIDQGHYTSLCRVDSLTSFVAFNDLSSETLTDQDIIDENYEGHPYLLFYELTT